MYFTHAKGVCVCVGVYVCATTLLWLITCVCLVCLVVSVCAVCIDKVHEDGFIDCVVYDHQHLC